MRTEDLAWSPAGAGARGKGRAEWDHVYIQPAQVPSVEACRMMLAAYGFVIRELPVLLERISINDNFNSSDPPVAVFYQIPWQLEDFFVGGSGRLCGRIGQWAQLSIRDVSEADERGLAGTIDEAISRCPFHLLYLWPGMDGEIPDSGNKSRMREIAVSILEPLRGVLPEDVLVKVPYATHGRKVKVYLRRFTQAQLSSQPS